MKKIKDEEKKKFPLIQTSIYRPDDNPPRFSFRYIISHDNFNYNSLEKEHKVALVNTLNQLSQTTWASLRTNSRTSSGYEIIQRLSLSFSIPNEIPKHAHIIGFKFWKDARMLGYRSAYGTFYIIAFDTKFKAYKH